MAGGPSTPALAAAVSAAGGLGFLAAGYKSPGELQADITRTRELTSTPVGVNLFLLAETPVDHARLTAYAQAIEPEAHRHRVAVGEPHFDDDSLDAKLEVVCRERPPITSFTFGCPAPEVVQRLHERDIAVWVTVTEVEEALLAAHAGADALIVQGVEAGGHRGSFEDADGCGEIGLLPLLRLVAQASELPLIASGGIADGAAVAAVLAAGARAAQIGTAFMRCPEAATSDRASGCADPSESHGSHARLQRPPRPRHRQRLHARPRLTRTAGLPARASSHCALCERLRAKPETPTRSISGQAKHTPSPKTALPASLFVAGAPRPAPPSSRPTRGSRRPESISRSCPGCARGNGGRRASRLRQRGCRTVRRPVTPAERKVRASSDRQFALAMPDKRTYGRRPCVSPDAPVAAARRASRTRVGNAPLHGKRKRSPPPTRLSLLAHSDSRTRPLAECSFHGEATLSSAVALDTSRFRVSRAGRLRKSCLRRPA